jgi:hypothetical protein
MPDIARRAYLINVIHANLVQEDDSDRKAFRSKALMNILKKKEEDNKNTL